MKVERGPHRCWVGAFRGRRGSVQSRGVGESLGASWERGASLTPPHARAYTRAVRLSGTAVPFNETHHLMTTGEPRQSPSTTTGRVLSVLAILAEADRPQSAAQVGRRAGLARATAHRFLGLLRDAGFADQSNDGYVAGQEYHRLARLVAGRDSLRGLAREQMRALVAATGETSVLAEYLPNEHRVVWRQAERGPRALGYRVTLDGPATLVWGASGRAILSALPPTLTRKIIDRDSGERSPTLGTLPPTRSEMEEELALIRCRGYAQSLSHVEPHAFSIAAPVFGRDDTVRGALSVSMPEMRVGAGVASRVAPLVVSCADELSRQLGASTTESVVALQEGSLG